MISESVNGPKNQFPSGFHPDFC